MNFALKMIVHISDDKTKVVIFHKSFLRQAERNFQYKVGEVLVSKAPEYKYLGLIFGAGRAQHSRLMTEAALRGTRAKAVLYKLFAQLGVSSNFYLKLRLFKAVMLPNLTYGCEIWGSQLLHMDPKTPFDNPVDQVTTTFLRNLLGVKSGTSNWCLYREVGMYPMQLFCFRQMIRFMHKLKQMPDHTWARVALFDMARDAKNGVASNWVTHLVEFARSIGVTVRWSTYAHGDVMPEFEEQSCISSLRGFYYNLFVDVSAPSKMRRYHRLFGKRVSRQGARWHAADYTFMPLLARKSYALARCRLFSHRLKVETGGWGVSPAPVHTRLCQLCDIGAIQNEHHIVFDCPHFSEQRHAHLLPYLQNAGERSIWYLFNEPQAQSSLAEFLLSTKLMTWH